MKKRVTGIVSSIALLALTTMSCGQQLATGGETESPETQNVESAPCESSPEPRFFIMEPSQGAPALIKALTHEPQSRSLRRQLVVLYTEKGYWGTAHFFENTIRELNGQSLVTERVRTGIAWRVSPDDVTGLSDEVAREVLRLTDAGRYEEATEMASRSLERDASLRVTVQWARAALWKAILESPANADFNFLEVAIRVYTTSLEGHMPLPFGVDARSTGYHELAKLFLRLGDAVSCRVAARLALEDLNVTEDSPEWDKFAVEQLEAILHKTEDIHRDSSD